ncbi:MAG: bifunctional demethylmenaquinone methyltransferase/2-methoxy-6-polyprenyl-1,4-benzoquinol methylase UbiE [Candidatus Lightella neohaematopini]|nr:bifunctional demethylmenaquinone methyltransferase/2-methoxy-6-polyprenyl-1,4-benzoquinol methylase UbiE [Candidatus Lightella neohaematopini]
MFYLENKKNKIIEIFNKIANRYDLMNDIMSFGIHRIWKKILINYSDVSYGEKILNLACGTGDLTYKLSSLVGNDGEIILLDINFSMLKNSRIKLRNIGILGNINYIQGDAEELPFSKNIFDCIIISFGIRNFLNKDQVLKSSYKILKLGGRIIILEFSKPLINIFRKIYNLYSFNIIPLVGKIITNSKDSYEYLVKSIRLHPNQEELKSIIINAGFSNVNYINLTGGIVAIHKGYKI